MMTLRLLRHAQRQNAVFKLRVNILFGHSVADIEAALHRAGVALLTNHLAALVLLVLVQTLFSAYGEITVFKVKRDLILLEARQIDFNIVAVLVLVHVGLHDTRGVLAVQLAVNIVHAPKRSVHPIIKEIITKDTRHQHNSYLLKRTIRFVCCYLSEFPLRTLAHPMNLRSFGTLSFPRNNAYYSTIVSTVKRRVLIYFVNNL